MSTDLNPSGPHADPHSSRPHPSDPHPSDPLPSDPYPRSAQSAAAVTIREPAAIYCTAVATEPRNSEARWMPEIETVSAPYSIRVPVPAGEIHCPRCGNGFLAAGPTGYAGEQPICDLCLLDGSHPLGMLLALAAVVRTFGVIPPGPGDDYREALEEIAAFARVYERFAAKSGPPRPFRLPDLELE